MQVIKLHPDAILPKRATDGAAGHDLHCIEDFELFSVNHPLVESTKLSAVMAVRTGIAVSIPLGYCGRVTPRSSLAKQCGIGVNGGLIDSDYRGELIVMLHQLVPGSTTFKKGNRIAQLVIEKIATPEIVEVAAFSTQTARGDGGFGSTGK